MKNINKLSILFIISLFFGSCGLEKMAMDYHKVNFVESPSILESHGGNVQVNFKGEFPEMYFAKNATLEVIPVIIDQNGLESKLKSIIIQGEQASGGEATIFYESGGDFSYSDEIKYTDDMISSSLELRATARLNEMSKVLGPITIADGTIITSQRVQDNEIPVFAHHEYEDTSILSKSATIYFLVNKSNIRTSEKSDADVKKLQEFIKKGYSTASFEIKSYASPEGSVSLNDELSEDRNRNTLKYAKYLLKKLKADGSSDNANYITVSVGEDWDGFYNLVNNSTISDKGIINRIVKSNKTPEQKEQAIRDMAEVYDAVDQDILPYLRKAEITINSYQPKKTKEEIINLSTTDPSSLDANELLYAAILAADDNIKMDIYNSVISIYNDWRGYNNIAAMYMLEGDIDNASIYLSKATKNEFYQYGELVPVLMNQGILASWNGDNGRAEVYYIGCDYPDDNYKQICKFDKDIFYANLANFSLRIGDYRSANRYYRGQETYNATLSKILHGDNEARCNENTADCYYLNAIASARSGDPELCFSNIEKAINLDENYKIEAAIDLEFINYRENKEFKSIIE